MARSRISLAKSEIVETLDRQESPVFKHSELSQIFARHRAEWRLPVSMTLESFLDYLKKNSKLKVHRFEFPSRAETVYAWGEVSPKCIACAIKPNGYLSHYSAMETHELTDQVPETIYVNHEQRPQPKPDQPPTQSTVDRAFRGKQRISKTIARFGRRRVCLLNGKFTNQLGVINVNDSNGCEIRVASLERTLIDIVVRPAYAGGVSEILEAYRRAATRVQINQLIAFFRKMEYAYPYEQAIGFYMDRCGAYKAAQLDLVRHEASFELDFYLTYGMQKAEYSSQWRIFFPAGL